MPRSYGPGQTNDTTCTVELRADAPRTSLACPTGLPLRPAGSSACPDLRELLPTGGNATQGWQVRMRLACICYHAPQAGVSDLHQPLTSWPAERRTPSRRRGPRFRPCHHRHVRRRHGGHDQAEGDYQRLGQLRQPERHRRRRQCGLRTITGSFVTPTARARWFAESHWSVLSSSTLYLCVMYEVICIYMQQILQ